MVAGGGRRDISLDALLSNSDGRRAVLPRGPDLLPGPVTPWKANARRVHDGETVALPLCREVACAKVVIPTSLISTSGDPSGGGKCHGGEEVQAGDGKVRETDSEAIGVSNEDHVGPAGRRWSWLSAARMAAAADSAGTPLPRHWQAVVQAVSYRRLHRGASHADGGA